MHIINNNMYICHAMNFLYKFYASNYFAPPCKKQQPWFVKLLRT
jgi:hypothetical protein